VAVPPYRREEGNVASDLEQLRSLYANWLTGGTESEADIHPYVTALEAALQEERAESLRQAEIARDALTEAERLTALLAVERGQREDTEATLEAIKVILPHRVEHNGEIPNEIERLTARVTALTTGIALLTRGLRDRDEPRSQLAAIAENLLKEARAALPPADG
jgi:hypothetical protein